MHFLARCYLAVVGLTLCISGTSSYGDKCFCAGNALSTSAPGAGSPGAGLHLTDLVHAIGVML